MKRLSRANKNSPSQTNPLGWMITFSDLITLILTFFVMIICISVQEPPRIFVGETSPEYTGSGTGVMKFSKNAPINNLEALVKNLDTLPPNLMLDQEEVKSAIFQLEPTKAKEFQKLSEAAKTSVDVFVDDRGLVIKWDQNLLFTEGSTTLSGEYTLLLQKLVEFFTSISLPISLECHTNPFSDLEGGEGLEGYKLSGERAKVIMNYLISLGVSEKRFRLGAFGGSQPIVTNDPTRYHENGRLEFIIYKPKKSSWRG